jgi:hypothetical protein
MSGRDPLLFVEAVVVLGAVVLAASWLPAWRESQVSCRYVQATALRGRDRCDGGRAAGARRIHACD